MATMGDCAAHLFMSERRFQEFINSGVVTKQGRGAYDLDVVREQYIRHLREQAAGRTSEGDLDLTEERARLAKEQADAQEMKNAVMRGELLPIGLVKATWGKVLSEFRTRILGVPSVAAPRILPGMKTAEVEAVIRDHVDDALSVLSGDGGMQPGTVPVGEGTGEADAEAEPQPVG